MDPAVYTGLLGTAFTCLRSYEATGSQQDLLLSAEIVDTCADVARASTRFFFVLFLKRFSGFLSCLIGFRKVVGNKVSGEHHRTLLRLRYP
jgi:hypothetical protein